MTQTQIYEWAGTIFGLIGALLLATNTRYSRYGWLAFFAANIAMIAFAIHINANGLMLQQFGFIITSIIGLYRAGFLTFAKNDKLKMNNTQSIQALKDWVAATCPDDRIVDEIQSVSVSINVFEGYTEFEVVWEYKDCTNYCRLKTDKLHNKLPETAKILEIFNAYLKAYGLKTFKLN